MLFHGINFEVTENLVLVEPFEIVRTGHVIQNPSCHDPKTEIFRGLKLLHFSCLLMNTQRFKSLTITIPKKLNSQILNFQSCGLSIRVDYIIIYLMPGKSFFVVRAVSVKINKAFTNKDKI